jgi:hypothetical protein
MEIGAMLIDQERERERTKEEREKEREGRSSRRLSLKSAYES